MPVSQGIYKAQAAFDATGTTQAVPTQGGVLVGIYVPASMVGTSLTFKVSQEQDEATLFDLYDSSSTQITATITGAARYVSMLSRPFGADEVQVISNSTSDVGKVVTLVFQKVA
jgi:hypothetical protein